MGFCETPCSSPKARWEKPLDPTVSQASAMLFPDPLSPLFLQSQEVVVAAHLAGRNGACTKQQPRVRCRVHEDEHSLYVRAAVDQQHDLGRCSTSRVNCAYQAALLWPNETASALVGTSASSNADQAPRAPRAYARVLKDVLPTGEPVPLFRATCRHEPAQARSSSRPAACSNGLIPPFPDLPVCLRPP